MSSKAKPKPLATRLRQARTLLLDWQKAVRDSHIRYEPGPTFGTVDEETAGELQRFHNARQAIRLVKGPKS